MRNTEIKKVIRKKTGFSVTPGFIVMLAAMLALQKVFLFLGYILSVLIHELAHFLAARRLGYDCIKVRLSVFGAVLYGDFNELSQKEEIIVAFAGPLANLIVSVILLALWWVFPEAYNYTGDILTANLCIALVNFLPCYPLDGGRILKSLVIIKNKKSPIRLIQFLCSIIGGAMFVLFVLSLFTGHNLFNLGIFAIFVFSGGVSVARDSMYQKLFMGEKVKKRIAKGAETRIIAMHGTATVHEAYKKCDHSHYCIILVINNNGKKGEIDIFDLEKLLTISPQAPLSSVCGKA